ncbi:PREDICTED: uncharacterized protein LOC105971083 [Erythranthe guttata]|nr:PREDICTED: uncharacterized protein LOC105971083 [Erythranthe guttata]|eukprot:XP_012851385.1 PREDICTED: uncharacterized protein LOC105971083 [Erythranthe guttata]
MQTENTLAFPVSGAKPTTTDDKSAPPIRDRHMAQFHKGIIKDDVSTLLNRVATSDDTKGSTFYDRAVSVITLAGENRGASMHVGPDSSNRDGPVHIHRSYNKINPDENNDAEESSREKKKSEDAKQDKPSEAYINNNAQGINNSIVFNGSVTERNPGVHMAVTHVAKEPVRSTNDGIAPEARRAEFNTTRAEKLTYEPTIRRRCLRGLFLETSDSDNDNNLEKPRRHGCRVGCQEIRG